MSLLKELDKLFIEKYTIHDDKSITVHQNVDISDSWLTKIPIKFRKIEGNFNCSHNKLISLEGVPQIIKGNFHCSYNKLINLNGLPLIGMYFTCDEYLYEDINYQRYKLKKQIKYII
jgi:hypothetical protein